MSNKWVITVIAALADGPLRYTEIHRSISPPISQKVLAETLSSMQRNHLVIRNDGKIPARTGSYELTEFARELFEPLAALAQWHSRTSTS